MAMKKSQIVFVILDTDGIQGSEKNFQKALKKAQGLCDGSSDVKILEVVKAWNVEYPEEPLPEEYEINLEDL